MTSPFFFGQTNASNSAHCNSVALPPYWTGSASLPKVTPMPMARSTHIAPKQTTSNNNSALLKVQNSWQAYSNSFTVNTNTHGGSRKRARKESDSRNTLRAPPVPEADCIKVKKCPQNICHHVDSVLRDKFDIPGAVKSFVGRPATKDMGKYWYVLWNCLFALLERDGDLLLKKSVENVKSLLQAHIAAKPVLVDLDESTLSNNSGKAVSATKNQASAPSNPFFAPKPVYTTKDLADEKVLAALEVALQDLFVDCKTSERVRLLCELHNTIWSFIFAIVERLGDMFLTKSCLFANAMQISKMESAQQQRSRPNVSLQDCAPSALTIGSVRQILFRAFENLSH